MGIGGDSPWEPLYIRIHERRQAHPAQEQAMVERVTDAALSVEGETFGQVTKVTSKRSSAGRGASPPDVDHCRCAQARRALAGC
jgi:hypothetical protein